MLKFANVEEILEIKNARDRIPVSTEEGQGLAKFAALRDDKSEEDGYLYVRCRAISSRVNKNNDGWPADELMAAYKTFINRPIFVDHNNDNPRRARGVIVDAQVYVDEDEKTSALDPYYSSAPENHKPPTHIELLLEVDAESFPKLADAVRNGDIDAVSMGANIDRSVCSVCANEAATPAEYCTHIKQKGITFEITADNGEKIKKKAYEDCYGVNFFEISFVFDPADETALISEKIGQKVAAPGDNIWDRFVEPVGTENKGKPNTNVPQADMTTAPQKVDTLRNESLCPNCKSDYIEEGADGIKSCPTCQYVAPPQPLDNPDLDEAKDQDLAQEDATEEGNEEVQIDRDEPARGIEPVRPVERTTRKETKPTQGISEMEFNELLVTTSREIADKVLKVAAEVETTVGFRGGIHMGTHMAFKQAGISAVVTYLDMGESNAIPGNPMKDMMLTQRASKSGIDPADIRISVSSDTPDEAIAIIQAGGGMGGGPRGASRKRSATSDKRKPLLPDSQRKSDEPQNEKIIADQLKPVESAAKALLAKLQEMESAFEQVEADRRHIVREEREEDGAIVRTEEIVEEAGDPKAEAEQEAPEAEVEIEEPEAAEEQKPELAVANSEKRQLAAFSLADEMVELGLLQKEEKYNFIAKLENESLDGIEARRETVNQVKEAGLTRKAAVQGVGIRRVPRLSHTATSENATGSIDEIPDAAIFWNG